MCAIGRGILGCCRKKGTTVNGPVRDHVVEGVWSMNIVGLVVAFASGAVGAHQAATRVRRQTSGLYATILSGSMGGLIGSQVIERAMGGAALAAGDLGFIAVQILGGAAGGAALLIFIETLRRFLQR